MIGKTAQQTRENPLAIESSPAISPIKWAGGRADFHASERPEGADAGTLKLVGTNEETIYNTFKHLLENKEEYNKMSHACNPYGDDHACDRIADILEGKEYKTWIAG